MIAKMTGHRSRELKRYQHLSETFLRNTAELIAGDLEGDSATDTPRKSRRASSPKSLKKVAEPTGLEPATSDVTGRRSNQLNYDSARNIDDFRLPISDLEKVSLNRQSEIDNWQCNWWARRDSNPQPLPCKGSRLPLTYVPVFKNQRNLLRHDEVSS